MKRILLFLGMNLGIILMLTFTWYIISIIFGIPMGSGTTIGLWVFALIFGFGGAFISLFLSKWIVKKTTNLVEINEYILGNGMYTDKINTIINRIKSVSRQEGIKEPEMYIEISDIPNAFATGASKNSSLVAVSEGLLKNMNKDEIDAVVGHEMAHITNGDMVTMTLLQGVLNTFVIVIARLLGGIIDNYLNGDENGGGGSGWGYFLIVMLLEVVLGVIATIILLAFSRWREYRADSGGALYTTKEAMKNALIRLKSITENVDYNKVDKSVATLSIGGSIGTLFSSHPPLDERIKKLED